MLHHWFTLHGSTVKIGYQIHPFLAVDPQIEPKDQFCFQHTVFPVLILFHTNIFADDGGSDPGCHFRFCPAARQFSLDNQCIFVNIRHRILSFGGIYHKNLCLAI